MSRARLKTAGRLAGLLLMVVATLGTCSPPLVWGGEGYCACLVTLAASLGQAANLGDSAPLLSVLCLPAVLPFVSTLFLLVGAERRAVWAGHLAAWGLAGAYALIWFAGIWYIHRVIWLWGAGLCVVVAVAMLVGEVVAARRNRREAAGMFQAP
jgi:hypothetical protein